MFCQVVTCRGESADACMQIKFRYVFSHVVTPPLQGAQAAVKLSATYDAHACPHTAAALHACSSTHCRKSVLRQRKHRSAVQGLPTLLQVCSCCAVPIACASVLVSPAVCVLPLAVSQSLQGAQAAVKLSATHVTQRAHLHTTAMPGAAINAGVLEAAQLRHSYVELAYVATMMVCTDMCCGMPSASCQ
jgi:hypothetical protein